MFNTSPFGLIVRPYTGTPTGSPLELFLMLQQQGQLPMGPETIDAQRMRNFRRVRPSPFGPMAQFQRPMPTPFPAGMQTGMGYGPPMQREIAEQAPAQWPMPAKLPSIRQFMLPAGVPDAVPQPATAMQLAPEMQPQIPMRSSGPVFPPSRPEAVTPEARGGMDPMSMALLAAGLRTLQHAGPSTQRVSLGQALASGGLEGLQTYASLRNQQAEEAFRERQLVETSDLRREQIASMRDMREAQAGELASKAEERQRNAEWMQRYQAAAPEEKMGMLKERYPEEVLKAELREKPEKSAQFVELPTGQMIGGKPAFQNYAVVGRNPDGTPKLVPQGKAAPKGALAETNVFTGPVAGVDKDGNPVFFQPSKTGGQPKLIEGFQPPEAAAARKTRMAEEKGQAALKASIKQVDDIRNFVRANPSAVGVSGIARRIGEGVSGQLGAPLPPTASKLASKINLFKSSIWKDLVGSGQLSKADYDHLSSILKGLGPLDSPATTIAAFDEVESYLRSRVATSPEYTQEDLEYTAKKHGISVDEVKKRLTK